MDLGLSGKRVLITGGSRGIGFACARGFLGEGADVVIAARDPRRLDAAKRELGARAQRTIETIAIDMAAPGSAATLAGAFPELDILVNNAGAIPGGDILAVDEAKWRAAWDLKVFGYVNLAREMFGRMRARKRGVIVNVIGLGGERHNFNYVAGAAGNASLMSFTHAMGAHSTDHGIRVVGVNPGLVATERMEFLMRTRAKNELGDAARWRELVGKLDLPFGRPASAAEVANVVVFLASDRAGYISGDVVRVDGGALHRGR
ncbi:MAG TPA: short-chain dehydrogenase/reductase [Alphaproteobacteria bacterium]|jgi:NAD(P)-dependent dehydrogenase (short-subunit alcohol dehydrogenase family)